MKTLDDIIPREIQNMMLSKDIKSITLAHDLFEDSNLLYSWMCLRDEYMTQLGLSIVPEDSYLAYREYTDCRHWDIDVLKYLKKALEYDT